MKLRLMNLMKHGKTLVLKGAQVVMQGFSQVGGVARSIFGVALVFAGEPVFAGANGFQKVTDTMNNLTVWLISISVGVVTIAIMWAGFKIVFQGSKLADVANILYGSALVGGAGAIAAYLVN